ncbi:MAG: hypothetical protein ACK5ZA_07335 [Betaproteobacteria bacterium]
MTSDASNSSRVANSSNTALEIGPNALPASSVAIAAAERSNAAA